MGIGAIYLNSSEAEFSYKTQKNQTLGELKETSFFLNEDGTTGNIAQIDFSRKDDSLSELLQTLKRV